MRASPAAPTSILIPEIPYDLDKVVERLRERESFGARFSIVVVAEGAKTAGRRRDAASKKARGGHVERLGGIGALVAAALQEKTGKETRYVVLGHLQRGGAPTAFDRVLATRFGGKAVELICRGSVWTDGREQPAGYRADPARGCRGEDQDGAARLRLAENRASDRGRVRGLSSLAALHRCWPGFRPGDHSQHIQVLQRAAGVEQHDCLVAARSAPSATSRRSALSAAPPSGAAD